MPPDGFETVTVHERTVKDLEDIAGEDESLSRVIRRLVETHHEYADVPHPWDDRRFQDQLDAIEERTGRIERAVEALGR